MGGFNTLVVLQPTEFCNIDCTYCYLPHRSRKSRMSSAVLRRVFQEAFNSPVITRPVTFLWHLGEPLAIPRDFYEEAFAICAEEGRSAGESGPYQHEFQSNGILLNDHWLEFIARHQIGMGISVDGPAHIHDRVRVTRKKTGTHAEVMRGIRLLQEAQLPFSSISVITTYSLDYADEMFDFFDQNDIRSLGFNIDEMEGGHSSSTFQTLDDVSRYRAFIRRFIERIDATGGAIKLREVWSHLPRILTGKSDSILNATNKAFHIVNVSVSGEVSTFCPELVTANSVGDVSFSLGNILDTSVAEMAASVRFQELSAQIQAGKDKCRAECEYWDFCGGGSPANKFFETGRLDVSETLTCRMSIKENVNATLEFLEAKSATAKGRPDWVP